MMSWLNSYLEEISLSQILPLLRLTRWDPVMLVRLFPVIARQARNAIAERADLRDAVLNTWENHYPLNKDENVLAFYCGVILLELRFFLKLIRCSGNHSSYSGHRPPPVTILACAALD